MIAARNHRTKRYEELMHLHDNPKAEWDVAEQRCKLRRAALGTGYHSGASRTQR
jgi:hypothetical protein